MSYPASSDQDLVKQVLSGNTKAFSKIVTSHQSSIIVFVQRMVRSRALALDLSQEVFVRAYTSLHTFEANKALRPWLYRIALNLVRDHFRNPKNRIMTEAPGKDRAINPAPTPEAAWLEKERNFLLQQALTRLPPDQGEAIVLRFYQDMGFEEMSIVLGIKASTAKMRVYRGLERLARMLED